MWWVLRRALASRRGLALAVFVVATVTTAAAAIGPFYFRSASESILRDRLSFAAVQDVGIRLSNRSHARDDPAAVVRRTSAHLGVPFPYRRSISSLALSSTWQRADGATPPANARLLYRDGACGHLTVVAGRCPVAAGEAMVSARTAARKGDYGYDWRIGARLMLNAPAGLDADPFVFNFFPPPPPTGLPLHVVGVYRPKDASEPFWFGQNYFDAHLAQGNPPDTVDSILVAAATFTTQRKDAFANGAVDYYLDPTRVRLANEPRLRTSTAAFLAALSRSHGDWFLDTSLKKQLDIADHDRRLLAVSVLVVSLQLGLLASVILYVIVAGAAEVRGPEIALAKLRGYTAGRTAAFGMAEPVALITAAVPVGLLLAYLSVRAISAAALAPDTPVALRLPPLLAALGGWTGAVLAAGLATVGLLRRPVVEQWRHGSGGSAHARPLAVAEAALLILAITGLVELRTSGALTGTRATNPIALLAPALLIVVSSTVVIRLLSLSLRLAEPLTRAGRHVAGFLAIRQVLRRPGALRLASLLAITIGLAVFAVDASAVAGDNQRQRALTETGGDRAYPVQVDYRTNLPALLDRIDPTSRSAVAVATWLPPGGSLGTPLLAVDSRRFAAVAHWRGDFADADLPTVLRRLTAGTPAPLVLRGDAVRISATAAAGTGAPTTLAVSFGGDLPEARLGVLRSGPHDYVGRLPRCPNGCRVRAIHLEPAEGDLRGLSGTLALRTLAVRTAGVWRPVQRAFPAGGWAVSPDAAATVRVVTDATGVRYDYRSNGGPPPALERLAVPRPLPALVDRSAAGRPGLTVSQEENGSNVPVRVVARSGVLPGAGLGASMVDLAAARATFSNFDDEASYEVWVSRSAPADFRDRLEAAGLNVLAPRTVAARAAELSRTGPALGLLLYAVSALAGAILAAAATIVSLHVTARRRTGELAALGVAGAPRRTLFLTTFGEIGLALGLAGVAGVLAGVLAARLTLPAVPEFPDGLGIPPLRFWVHWLPVGLVALVVAVAVVLGALGMAGVILRRTTPSVLREPAA